MTAKRLVATFAIIAAGCGGGSSTPPTTPTPPVNTTPGLAQPVSATPKGSQQLTDSTVTLVVQNAAPTGTVTNVVYRFEWSEADTFPADSRTGGKDNVAQGTGQTSYTITDSLKPNAKYFWRARASSGAVTSDWSATESFVTLNKGFVSGQYLYDPLTDGTTVGSRVGGSFVPGQGWRADNDSDGLDYNIPTCSSCTVEFDVTNFGRGQGASALKDYKWLSMGNGSTFGDFTAFRDHPWKMHLEQRGDGDGTGMKLVWRNGAVGEGTNPGDHVQRNDFTVNWQASVVYHFTLRWTPSGYTVSVGIARPDGGVDDNRVWFQDSFGAHPYAPPNHRISLGTRSRSETMRGAIWRNVKVTPN